jgi:hypothetical protein
MIDFELLRAEVARHPYPLLFATISGAHLYGFPSPIRTTTCAAHTFCPQKKPWAYFRSRRRLSFRACATESKWIW